jgi:hypothetical protein
MENSGWIRVVMKGGWKEVQAKTFGETASKVECASGQIVRFEHMAEAPK